MGRQRGESRGRCPLPAPVGTRRLPLPVPGLGTGRAGVRRPFIARGPCRAPLGTGKCPLVMVMVIAAALLFPKATRKDAVVRPASVRVPGVLCGGQHGREGRHRGPPAGVQVSCCCPAHRHGSALLYGNGSEEQDSVRRQHAWTQLSPKPGCYNVLAVAKMQTVWSSTTRSTCTPESTPR